VIFRHSAFHTAAREAIPGPLFCLLWAKRRSWGKLWTPPSAFAG
jgi:hypothetical protein